MRVKNVVGEGVPADMPTLSAIGYGEIIQFLQDKLTYEEAIMLIKRNSRTFVRRQANWFKPDDPRIAWFRLDPIWWTKWNQRSGEE